MNFVYFHVFMRYVSYVCGEMRNVCNGRDSIWPALCVEDWKCGGSAEDRKAPHHLLPLSCPGGDDSRRGMLPLFLSHVEPLPPCV